MRSLGDANTIGDLIAILEAQRAEVGDDFPVRTRSLSHEWPVSVERHERCLLLTFG